MTSPILIADDDPSLQYVLKLELERAGFAVETAANEPEALDAIRSTAPQLVIADLAISDSEDCAELVRRIRVCTESPLVVISSSASDAERLKVMSSGASDYVAKPLSIPEMISRIRHILFPAEQEKMLRFRGLTLDCSTKTATRDSRVLDLTPVEFEILEFLARHAGRAVSSREIANEVAARTGVSADHVSIQIGSVRRKVESDAANPRFIIPEPRLTFRFIGEPL